MAGFPLAHELENYVRAGIPASEVLYDATLGEKARITSGHQVATFRNDTRDLTLLGERLSATYPTLPDVLAQYLDTTAGRRGDTLTAEQKKAWIHAFKTLANCGRHAAK